MLDRGVRVFNFINERPLNLPYNHAYWSLLLAILTITVPGFAEDTCVLSPFLEISKLQPATLGEFSTGTQCQLLILMRIPLALAA